jgi:hypothetical protein
MEHLASTDDLPSRKNDMVQIPLTASSPTKPPVYANKLVHSELADTNISDAGLANSTSASVATGDESDKLAEIDETTLDATIDEIGKDFPPLSYSESRDGGDTMSGATPPALSGQESSTTSTTALATQDTDSRDAINESTYRKPTEPNFLPSLASLLNDVDNFDAMAMKPMVGNGDGENWKNAAGNASSSSIVEQKPVPRSRTNQACVPCKNRHIACSGARPCESCIRRGLCSWCCDTERKRLGRPPGRTNKRKHNTESEVVGSSLQESSSQSRPAMKSPSIYGNSERVSNARAVVL